ncbi:MAG TPA: histidinol-phosphate transaminase [Solirubrobacteraceae bacterium]|nr:histidinol-phosphate transaminase [Solirubrobacteraceae bacterium]
MTAWRELLRPSVIDVGAYRPGVSGDETMARFGLTEVVRLNWNENLFGPLPGVLDEVAAALDAAWSYPEDSYEGFRRAVAAWAGADPGQVIPGHGIQALTLALVSAFVERGDSVVIPAPTYGLYAQACRVGGAVVHRVPCDDSLAIDLGAVAEAAREHGAKLAWVCDPNNPTGRRLDAGDWEAFLAAMPPRCVIVVDEAYGDYIEPELRIDRVSEISAGRPIVILRTFSKIFGLAGLRLGYALVGESLAPYLNAVHEPFNVNRAALAAGLASLRRVELLDVRRDQTRRARDRLVAGAEAAGIVAVRSDANFVLLELGVDDERVCEALAREGLLLRPGSELGLPGYVRVTTGDEQLMERVGTRLAEVVQRELATAPQR